MFEAPAQLADRLPEGVYPEFPDDPSAAPVLGASASRGNGVDLIIPSEKPRPKGSAGNAGGA
jgi:hypothetical protein